MALGSEALKGGRGWSKADILCVFLLRGREMVAGSLVSQLLLFLVDVSSGGDSAMRCACDQKRAIWCVCRVASGRDGCMYVYDRRHSSVFPLPFPRYPCWLVVAFFYSPAVLFGTQAVRPLRLLLGPPFLPDLAGLAAAC